MESVKMLEEQIEILKQFPDDEFADRITEKKKELQKLKAKLPVQEAQEVRDPCAMYSTLAELEQKYHSQKQQVEANIQETIDQREETVRNGHKGKKALDDMVIDKKLQIDENVELIVKNFEDEGKELREHLEALETYVNERKAAIQSKVASTMPTSAASTMQAPTAGAVSLEIAPGSPVHSNQVDPTVVQNFLANGGILPGQTQQVAELFLTLLNMLGTAFVAPPPAAAAPSTQSLSQEPVVIPDEKRPDADAVEMEFTDGSTDSEAEAAAATANISHTKIKKKESKKDRGAKIGKGGPGKGSAKDLVKSTDKDKKK